MYYYAFIEHGTGICYNVYESETPIIDDPNCIQIDFYDKSYEFRKKYVDGVWMDTTASEAQQFDGAHIGIFGEWLDVVINGKAPLEHSHSGYASSDELMLLEDAIANKANVYDLNLHASDTELHATYSAATTSVAGLMSPADKTKLDSIATGANKIIVDSAMSTTSTNPVQNKVVKAAISNIALTVNSDGVLLLSV